MTTNNSDTTRQKLITTLAVLIVITGLVFGVKTLSTKTPAVIALKPTQTTQQPTQTTSTNASSYRDGTYTSEGSYNSPGGNESIAVSLTIAGNTVTDATVQAEATDGVATVYQSYFVKGYKTFVVGKKVNDIHVSRVSGSSLTSQGFNSALAKIKQQAKA